MVLLLSFLGSSRTVFASGMQDYNYTSYDLGNPSPNVYGHFTVSDIVDEYNEHYYLFDNNGTYEIGTLPAAGEVYVLYTGLFSYTLNYSNFTGGMTQSIYSIMGHSGAINFNVGDTGASIIRVNVLDSEVTSNYNGDFRIYFYGGYTNLQFGLNGRIHDEMLNTGLRISINMNISVLCRYQNVSNINTVIQTAANNAPAFILGTNSSSNTSYICPYTDYEIRNILDTKLYNIWINTNLLYDQLVWNGNNNFASQLSAQLGTNSYNETSAINTAASQAAADADIAQSQAADILDGIKYDHSGTSQTVSATQSAYDAAQGIADAAVDNAVHNYVGDLSTVEAYDYSSFFTSQRNSAIFWRDVGEFILDSNNLGFVSGSIIIVTLIGLVIFMLRL